MGNSRFYSKFDHRGVRILKSVIVFGLVVVGAIAALELALRWVLGFGRPPLFITDLKSGYRLKPDQRLRRFGNRITINQYSMRSGPLAPTGTTLRIMLLGDSIANGGWWTDDSRTLSSLLAQTLQASLPVATRSRWVPAVADPPVEVLNASAGSWSPRSEWGYLQQFGLFEAQALVLLINTDDLFATAPSELPVGRTLDYPDRNPPLAVVELFQIVVPPQPDPELEGLADEPGDRVGAALAAIRAIVEYARRHNCEPIVAITPLKREVLPTGPRDYELRARHRLNDFLDELAVTRIDFLSQFTQVGDPDTLYRDSIHLSPTANTLVTQQLAQALQRHFQRADLPQ
jgi:hypothetical protein